MGCLTFKRVQSGKVKWEIVILENRKKLKIIGVYYIYTSGLAILMGDKWVSKILNKVSS